MAQEQLEALPRLRQAFRGRQVENTPPYGANHEGNENGPAPSWSLGVLAGSHGLVTRGWMAWALHGGSSLRGHVPQVSGLQIPPPVMTGVGGFPCF